MFFLCLLPYLSTICEHTADHIVLKKMVSKSFAYIAILAICGVALFVIVMDLLKYCFGIDPVAKERGKRSKKKRRKMNK